MQSPQMSQAGHGQAVTAQLVGVSSANVVSSVVTSVAQAQATGQLPAIAPAPGPQTTTLGTLTQQSHLAGAQQQQIGHPGVAQTPMPQVSLDPASRASLFLL
ncbi:unnamed protein product [Darwinula stevensoni]|uniref:Uncharacterized protein n=1 Tax=Darwinula stevensoni TaxID=69355 RepID=A0A7R9AJQ0_9CRUS|nr:unnamed protein product [Darwinula stevensoni]CAG0908809.1 unnamed protein product [Darwinula stevensoni]